MEVSNNTVTSELLLKMAFRVPANVPGSELSQETHMKFNDYFTEDAMFLDPVPDTLQRNASDKETTPPTEYGLHGGLDIDYDGYERYPSQHVERFSRLVLENVRRSDTGLYRLTTSYTRYDASGNSLLRNTLQFNYGDGNSYDYFLFIDGELIEKGDRQRNWYFDVRSGYITFYGTAPVVGQTIELTFVRYIGKKSIRAFRSEIDATYQEFNGKFETLKDDISGTLGVFEGRIDTIDASFQAVNTKIDTDISALSHRVDASLASLNTSVEQLIDDVSNSINTSIDELRVDVSAIQTEKITTFEVNNVDVSGDIDFKGKLYNNGVEFLNYNALDNCGNDLLVKGNLIPDTPDAYNLGTLEHPFRDLYLGPQSLYINGVPIIQDRDVGGTQREMVFSTTNNQNMVLQTTGSGSIQLKSTGSGALTMVSTGADVTLESNGGDVNVKSTTGGVRFDSLNGEIALNSSSNIQLNPDTLNGYAVRVNAPLIMGNGQVIKGSSEPLTVEGELLTKGRTTISGEMIVQGNFTVTGNTSYLDTNVTRIRQDVITVNGGNATLSSGTLAGIKINRGEDVTPYFFAFEEGSQSFKIGEEGDVQPVMTREDAPVDKGIPYWDNTQYRVRTTSDIVYDGSNVFIRSLDASSGHVNALTTNSLGIGTPSPNYNLDVSGEANASTLYENGVALESKYLQSVPSEYVIQEEIIDAKYAELGTVNTFTKAQTIELLENSTAISSGDAHTAILLNDGTIRTFGRNDYGQLGNGITGGIQTTPVKVLGISNAIAVACGHNNTVVLLRDGTVKTFGRNDYGQLGDGSTYTSSNTPVQVVGLSNAVAVACGQNHIAVVLSDGTLHTFGVNAFGQLGNGTTDATIDSIPHQVNGITNAVDVDCGTSHTVVVLRDGTVRSFGRNSRGQLGIGTFENSLIPVQVVGVSTAHKVSCGSTHTALLLKDGTVRTFGNNNAGQLGHGLDETKRASIVEVVNLDIPVVDVACGGGHTAFLLNDGTVKTVGSNNYGQLGVGTTLEHMTPIMVPDISDAIAISCGSSFTAISTRNGTVKTVGTNTSGQLGNGSFDFMETVPVSVVQLYDNVNIFRVTYSNTDILSLDKSGLFVDGNVGIGISPSSYNVDVSGSLNATSLYENGVALSNKYLQSIPSEYLTESEGDATYAMLTHTHTTADITDLSGYTGFDSKYVSVNGDTMNGTLQVDGVINATIGNFDALTINNNLSVNGQIYATGIVNQSDARIKRNIVDVSASQLVDRFRLLKPVEYSFASYVNGRKKHEKTIGFIAQDVENVFPEYVSRQDKSYSLSLNPEELREQLLELSSQEGIDIVEENGQKKAIVREMRNIDKTQLYETMVPVLQHVLNQLDTWNEEKQDILARLARLENK